MAVQFGATCFFYTPEEFTLVGEVARRFPFLQYVEFRGEYPFLFPGFTDRETLRHYREILRQANLRSTLHTTLYDVNLATVNPYLRDAAVTCYREYIDIAAYLGSEVIVVHGGTLPRDFAQSSQKEQYRQLAETHLCRSLTELAEYGQSKGVVVAVENLPPDRDENIIHDAQSHLRILRKVDHPNLKALYDMAHAYLYGLDVIDYLEKIRPHLGEIHAHNNLGQEDDHMGLPHGKMDYRPILKHPAVEGVPFIMEIRSYQEVMETLHWLQEIYR